MSNLMRLMSCLYHSNRHAVLTKSIENMLYTLHATYIRHDLYADFSLRFKRSLKEFFSQQIHSSRWTKSLAAQILTVYFLSMSCRRFVSNTHAYHSRFLLYSHWYMLLFSQTIQMISLTRSWFYHQDIQELKLSEEKKFLRSTVIIIIYHVLQTLTSLVKCAIHLFHVICKDLSHADWSCFAKMFICYTFNQTA